MKTLPGAKNESQYVKDGIHDYVVGGNPGAVNPELRGTKAAAHYRFTIGAGQSQTIRLRLAQQATDVQNGKHQRSPTVFGGEFDEIFAVRQREADEFYQSVTPPSVSPDEAYVMRQALAGMLWSKQFFYFDGDNWLDEHHSNPLHRGYRKSRNWEWFHMLNRDVISMPDKWEYPWYAAWDLAFHTLPISVVDPDFAKEQMQLMLRNVYLHPNGQMPAYEWNFSDVNPPVHAFATLFLHRTEQVLRGETDLDFLKSTFNKLMLNFSWWVNRKDRFGKNVFEGGFLGLDNIGVFDRSAPLPTGGHLEQADGGLDGRCSARIARTGHRTGCPRPQLRRDGSQVCRAFLLHCRRMNRSGEQGMWDEEDGFYYDLLQLPDGSSTRLKVLHGGAATPSVPPRSSNNGNARSCLTSMKAILERLRRIPELSEAIHPTGPGHYGVSERGILALVNPERLRRILMKLLDENEFLSPYGIRSLSKFHERHPFVFYVSGQEYRVDYLPAESNTGMFGGNSNWRGPVWMPVNIMIIRALLNFYLYYGDNLRIECPTGSGNQMNLFQVAKEIANRLTRIFSAITRAVAPCMAERKVSEGSPLARPHLVLRILPR